MTAHSGDGDHSFRRGRSRPVRRRRQVHFLTSVFAPGVKRRGRRAGSQSHFFGPLVGLPSVAVVATGDEVETASSLALILRIEGPSNSSR
jgi:hypothetical protein